VSVAASLRAAPVSVQLGEWEYDIPALPAADWLEALERGWNGVVPGLLAREDEVHVLADLFGGRITQDEITEAAQSVVEEATGRRWWTVEKLVATAMQPELWPTIHGSLMLRGTDPTTAAFGAVLNAIYVLMVENMKQEKRDSFDFQLNAPPPKVIAQEWDDEAAADDFMAALGQQANLHGG
jgi:hypothetical protein